MAALGMNDPFRVDDLGVFKSPGLRSGLTETTFQVGKGQGEWRKGWPGSLSPQRQATALLALRANLLGGVIVRHNLAQQHAQVYATAIDRCSQLMTQGLCQMGTEGA
jgi:hypothetical protein